MSMIPKCLPGKCTLRNDVHVWIYGRLAQVWSCTTCHYVTASVSRPLDA